MSLSNKEVGRDLAAALAWALAGYHGGPGSNIAEERRLLVEAANLGLLPAEWIERRPAR